MNKIYDNGNQLIGEYGKIVEYAKKQFENNGYEDIKVLLSELQELDLDNDTIICVNYDNGMGNTFDWWEQDTSIID